MLLILLIEKKQRQAARKQMPHVVFYPDIIKK